MRILTVAVAMAAFATAAPTLAQEGDQDSDEDFVLLDPILVESVNRVETPLDDSTRSVTVVTREEVEQQSRITNSVGDMLANVTPGFSQSTEANTDFGQTLRGRTFLTMIDGVPQSTPLRDGRRSLNSIDANAIERIEIVRGGTAIYGFGATGGLVNIITRRPEDGAWNVEAEQGVNFSATHPDDSLGTDTSLQVSGRTGELDYLANGSFIVRGGSFDSDGDRIPADPVGAQGGLADSNTYDFLGKLGYEFDENRQRVELTGYYYNMEQDSDWAGISFGGDPDGNVKTPAAPGNFNPVNPGTENTNLNLEYEHREVWGSTVDAQLYYGNIDVVYSKFPGFPQTQIVSEKIGSRITVDTPIAFHPMPFDVIWGVDYLHDQTSQHATDAPDFSPSLDQDALAGFAQLEVPVSDLGLISGGMRYETISVDVSDFTRMNGTFVPGGTLEFEELLFNLTGTVYVTDHIDIYGGYAQGFTLADIGRSIRDGTFANSSQAESEAQRSDNYEIGIRATYNSWDGALVGFFNTSDNGTTFDQNLNIVKQPEEIYGVEAVLNYDVSSRMTVGGTLTWMEGKVDLNDDGVYEEDLPTTTIPPMKVTSYIDYRFTDWWSTRLQSLYSGSRNPNSTQFGGTGDIDEYIIFDLYNSFAVGPGDLEIGISNLFNEDYFPVINQAYDVNYAYAEGPGTTVSATYAIRF